ncbi:MAG: hypothetical protein ACYC6W_08575 [Nitrosotalea sp.]
MTVLEADKKTIARSGGSSALYLSSLAKEYIENGDTVDYKLMIEGNEVKILVSKTLYNFGLDEIRKVAQEFDFRTDYDKALGEDTQVFSAFKDNLSLSYTKNLRDHRFPANVTLSSMLNEIDYDTYKHISTDMMTRLQTRYNVITRIEGDLDVINVLKEPERYKLDASNAFQTLRKAGKQIGISIIIRFDNRKNKIDEIKSAITELKQLDSKNSLQCVS